MEGPSIAPPTATSSFTPIDWPCQPLEEKITELWGHINAATYQFLKLVADYDAKEGWGRHGCADCAHWLNWQCGIGKVAAREKVRVAKALGELPEISASFEKGEISYSKVRAMTRIATPENEAVLMNIALHGTAAHMERIVRQYRRVERIEDARLAEELHRQRYLHYRYDDDGSFVLEARLPPEVGALFRKTIEAAEEVLYQEKRAEENEAEAPGSILHNGVSAETSAGETPATAEEREESSAGARRADALALLAERFMASEADNTGSSDRFLVTVHIDQASLSESDPADTGDTAATVLPLKPQRSELEHGPTLAAETARRLACDGPLLGLVEGDDHEPLNVGRKTRAIPQATKRALASRDGGCRFPSCMRTRFTEGHHIHHWADGGETRLSNLVTLCRFHHRLLHEGGFGLRATDDGLFVFSRPDGSRIADSGCFRGNISHDPQQTLDLPAFNSGNGVRIDPHTIRSRWTGEAMDSNMVIGALLHRRERPPV